MINNQNCPYCQQDALRVEVLDQRFHFIECGHCGARGPRVSISEKPFIGFNTVDHSVLANPALNESDTSSRLIAKNMYLEEIIKERTHALQKANHELRQLAYQDPLTGVGNRLMLDAWLTCKNPQLPITVMMIDLDHFKLINDRFGHKMGDEALAAVAKCLSNNTRKDDLLIRWGGEEFLLLLNDVGSEQACRIAESLRQKIESIEILPDKKQMTISIGLTMCVVENFDQAMAAADEALYQAKKAGRNRITVFG